MARRDKSCNLTPSRCLSSNAAIGVNDNTTDSSRGKGSAFFSTKPYSPAAGQPFGPAAGTPFIRASRPLFRPNLPLIRPAPEHGCPLLCSGRARRPDSPRHRRLRPRTRHEIVRAYHMVHESDLCLAHLADCRSFAQVFNIDTGPPGTSGCAHFPVDMIIVDPWLGRASRVHFVPANAFSGRRVFSHLSRWPGIPGCSGRWLP
jgi:hypothetical protein